MANTKQVKISFFEVTNKQSLSGSIDKTKIKGRRCGIKFARAFERRNALTLRQLESVNSGSKYCVRVSIFFLDLELFQVSPPPSISMTQEEALLVIVESKK